MGAHNLKILVDHKEDLTQPVVYAINAPQAMRQRGSNFCVQRSTCPCLNASCLSPFLGWFDSLCWNCAWIARLELSFQPGAIQQQTGSDLQALHAELFPGLCKGLTYTSAAHDFFNKYIYIYMGYVCIYIYIYCGVMGCSRYHVQHKQRRFQYYALCFSGLKFSDVQVGQGTIKAKP